MMETITTKDVVTLTYDTLNKVITEYVLGQGKTVSGTVAFALDKDGKWFAVMEVERKNAEPTN